MTVLSYPTPTQAIEAARRSLIDDLGDVSRSLVVCVWQNTGVERRFPVRSDPWVVASFGPPPDNRPYYVVRVEGHRSGDIPVWTSKVELYNKPDYLRLTIWDRLNGPSDPSEGT